MSSAGRERSLEVPAHPPRRPREPEVRDLREAELVLAQRQQQVRDPVGGGQLLARRSRAARCEAPAVATRTHQQSTRRPLRTQKRALLADQPGAELAALEREPGRGEQVALVVADEVAEQPERDALGRRVGAPAPRRASLAADRHHLARTAPRLDPGDRPGVREADQARPGT